MKKVSRSPVKRATNIKGTTVYKSPNEILMNYYGNTPLVKPFDGPLPNGGDFLKIVHLSDFST